MTLSENLAEEISFKEYATDLCLWSFLYCRQILYCLSHQGSSHVILGEKISPPNKKHQQPLLFFWYKLDISDQSGEPRFSEIYGQQRDVTIVVWINLIGVFGSDLSFHFCHSAYRKMFSRRKYTWRLNLTWIN